jgi:hypothetical protein
MYEYEGDYDPAEKEPDVPFTREVLKRSILLILASLSAGAFLVWIVRFDFVLWAVSFVLELSILALGFFAGYRVNKLIRKPTPVGVRFAVAIIIGLAVSVTALELSRSHKLIRISEKMWSSDDQ